MNKIGLVLAGGGGRGAYQIGVWKYLIEAGLDTEISAFAGTSVGALNACLIMQGDYKLAEHIWTKKIKDKILLADKSIITSIINVLDKSITSKKNVLLSIPTIISILQANGMFSRKGLLEIIDEYVDLEKISDDTRRVFATCLSLSNFKPKYFMLNGESSQRIKNILCATSAIPFVFQGETIDGIEYVDGGIQKIGDNLPIKALHEHGCNTVIVVHLKEKSGIDKSEFPNMEIIEICPEKSLGNALTGILDFSEKGAKKRIEAGYSDAKKTLLSLVF